MNYTPLRNTVYPTQFALLVFISCVTFKVVMLPAYIMGVSGRNAWISMLLMLAIEGIILALVFSTVKYGTLFTLPMPVFVKNILVFLLAFSCFNKTVLFVGETTSYCSTTLFDEGLWRLILVGLVPALGYLAFKGGNIIARVAQVFIWFFAGVIIFNIVFAEPTGNIRNIMPVEIDLRILAGSDKYLAWFGDTAPLLLLSVIPTKKRNNVPVFISYILVVVFTVGIMLAFIMVYGSGGQLISNAFNKLSIFNELSTLLGTVDFPVVCAWLIMAVLKLSLLLFATVECVYYFVGNKKAVVVCLSLVIGLLTFFGIQNQKNLHNIMTGFLRYTTILSDYIVPVVAFVFVNIYKKSLSYNQRNCREVV